MEPSDGKGRYDRNPVLDCAPTETDTIWLRINPGCYSTEHVGECLRVCVRVCMCVCVCADSVLCILHYNDTDTARLCRWHI